MLWSTGRPIQSWSVMLWRTSANGEFVNSGHTVWTHVTWNTRLQHASSIAELQPARAI